MADVPGSDYWQPGCRCVLVGANLTLNGCPIHATAGTPVELAAPIDFSRPCGWCRAGGHDRCEGICGCIADHADDTQILRGFKRLKRLT